MGVIWFYQTAIDLDLASRILIPNIIAMVPLILLISTNNKIFPNETVSQAGKGDNQ